MKTFVMGALFALLVFASPLRAAEPEKVTVPAGDVELAGRLHRPEGGGARPAVVLLAGSQDSRNPKGLAKALAKRGIVVLDLYKRGVGGSGGRWDTETIPQRAGDAIAAVRWLQRVPGVDPARVGVVGHSQGGWVAQLAAADSSDIAFVVLLAGPAQTVREQILTDERSHLAGWGVPPHEVEARIRMMDQLMGAAVSNPAVCGEVQRHYLCGMYHYDPAAAIARIQVPVLALYGGKDPMVPPSRNLERLRGQLPAATRERLVTRVFPNGNHFFMTSNTGLRDEYERLSGEYEPGFLDTIGDWVRARARAR